MFLCQKSIKKKLNSQFMQHKIAVLSFCAKTREYFALFSRNMQCIVLMFMRMAPKSPAYFDPQIQNDRPRTH